MENENKTEWVLIKQKRLLICMIAVLVAVIAIMLLKPPLPRPPKAPGPPKHREVGKIKTIQGTVLSFTNNPHFDVDGIQIRSAKSGIITIDFLPHTASMVTTTAAIGDSVICTYQLKPDNETVGYQMLTIENKQKGLSVNLTELPPPPRIPDHAAENFNLLSPALITDRYGGIVALKKDSLLFHFKPGMVDDILPIMKTSRRFGLVAVRRGDQGFVNVDRDRVYIVISITIGNQTFLLR